MKIWIFAYNAKYIRNIICIYFFINHFFFFEFFIKNICKTIYTFFTIFFRMWIAGKNYLIAFRYTRIHFFFEINFWKFFWIYRIKIIFFLKWYWPFFWSKINIYFSMREYKIQNCIIRNTRLFIICCYFI